MSLKLGKRRALAQPVGRKWRAAAGAAMGLVLGGWLAAAGCGARTGLGSPPVEEVDSGTVDALPDVPATGEFCAEETYDSGPTDLSMFVLLDRSGSMLNDNRWAAVSAAISAFVSDPKTEGLGIGLQFYPHSVSSGNCKEEDYAIPAVPIAKLPSNAEEVKAALAEVNPGGETPTLPALRGGVQYSRGVMLANPQERVVIALVTDGAPNACDSTAEKVAQAEQEAASTDPKVLTYVIGLATGYTDEIALMASAGGTGKPILVDDGANAAQTLVDAMLSVKLAQEKCVFGVPIPPGVQPAATDLSVSYRTAPDAPAKELPIVADFASCSGEAFYPDDVEAPGSVALCPTACEILHQNEKSSVTVTAGCGMGTDGGLPDAKPDAPGCGTTVTFSCVESCSAPSGSAPACIDGAWTCPPGTFPDDTCATCPAVPHGCCQGDGTFVIASCVGAKWTCPPGATLFGEPGCSAPEVCTGTLPCPFGSYCDVPDDSCGKGIFLGTCQPLPASCPGGGPKVCGCDGAVHDSVCAAASDGEDVDGDSDCSTPSGLFACGGYYCKVGSQVCRETITFGEMPVPDAFECIDVPINCGIGCSCKLCAQCPPNGPCGTCGPEGEEGGVYLHCTTFEN